MAYNLHRFNYLDWVMETSLTKTLAHKLRISVPQVYRRFSDTIQTEYGPRAVLRVEVPREGRKPLVAMWGDTNLRWRANAILDDNPKPTWNKRTEIVERLLADTCELCGSQERAQVHHIRALKDLRQKGRQEKPEWITIMAARRRKTLVLCQPCHSNVHSGKPLSRTLQG